MQILQSHSEFVLSDGGCQHSGHCTGAWQNCEEGVCGPKCLAPKFQRENKMSNKILTCSIFACPLQVQDKFRLDLSDEEAVHYMQSLIDESVGALFAAVVEQIHKFAQVCMFPHFLNAILFSLLQIQHGNYKRRGLFMMLLKTSLFCYCSHFYGW